MNDVILSPSDFAFGFDQCKKCYYDKIVNKVKLNGMFPSVFSKFDRCQKHYYHNKNSKYLNQDLDDGIINTEKSDFMMVSSHLSDNKNRPFILRGKLDAFFAIVIVCSGMRPSATEERLFDLSKIILNP